MRRFLCVLGVMLLAVVVGNTAAQGAVEVEKLQRLSGKAAVTDTAVSADGRHFYLLDASGTLSIYDRRGRLQDTVAVGAGYGAMDVAPDGSKLYLITKDRKAVDVLALDYTAQVNLSGSPFKGAVDAPVVIVEYSDFQCPYCKRLQPTLKRVLEMYPGKVKLVFKHLPLIRIHKYAMNAAISSMAAGRQGKFWEFHDELFAANKPLTEETIDEIARKLGLDMERYKQDKRDSAVRAIINRDMQEAARNNVRGTPTLFINGRRLKNRSIDGFKEAIERELARVAAQAQK